MRFLQSDFKCKQDFYHLTHQNTFHTCRVTLSIMSKLVKTNQAGSIKNAIIHLKHRVGRIIAFISACHIKRVILIRLLQLVSAVIENPVQFAQDINTARSI